MSYIITANPDDLPTAFGEVQNQETLGKVFRSETQEEIGDHVKKTVFHRYRFVNDIRFFGSNEELRGNFLEYWETTEWVDTKGKGQKQEFHFSWITDLELRPDNIERIMRGERALWKIENENFNTLKNQGYNFEHNFCHGYQFLSSVFVYLMMLAFLFDQMLCLSCEWYQKAKKTTIRQFRLFKEIRVMYIKVAIESWNQ